MKAACAGALAITVLVAGCAGAPGRRDAQRTAGATAFTGRIDVRDYANLQDAVDALPPAGGMLFIPGGTYTARTRPAFTGLTLPARVQILGEGRGVTVLDASGQSPDLDLITIGHERCAVKEMTLQHNGERGSGKGIVIGRAGHSFQGTVVESVDILSAPDWAIDVWGTDPEYGHGPGTFSLHNTFRRVRCAFTPATTPNEDKGSIRIGRSCTTQWILECDLKGEGYCLKTSGTGTVAMNTTFEPHAKELCPPVSIEDGALSTHIVNCYFENWSETGEQFFIALRGRTQSVDVQNCHFVKHAGTNPRLLQTSGVVAARDVVLINPYYLGVQTPSGEDDLHLRHAEDDVTLVAGRRADQAYSNVEELRVRGRALNLKRVGGGEVRVELPGR